MRTTQREADTVNGTHKGDIFTVAVQFRYQGVAVTVSNPVIRIQHYDDQNFLPFRCTNTAPTSTDMKEWQLNESGELYSVDIDPLGLPLGWYHLYFEGEYTSGSTTGKLQLKGTMEVKALTREDRILNKVLKLIADDDIEAYYDYAGKYLRFKPSSLLTFLEMGIDFINQKPPMNTNYDISSLPLPYDELLVRYIVARAMFSKARLAIDNDLEVSDSHAIATKYFDKYLRMYEKEIDMVSNDISGLKKMNPALGSVQLRNRYPAYFTSYYGLSYAGRRFFSGTANYIVN